MDRYYCPCCGKRFEQIGNLKLHYQISHDLNYCPICKKKYKSVAKHSQMVFERKNCCEHAILYWLSAKYDRSSGLHKKAREIVEKYLKGERKIEWKC